MIRRSERNKRKFVTVIAGLDAFGLDLKKLSKDLGKKFACGASVTRNAAGTADEITVQGDVSEEAEDWLLETYEGLIPEDNVELVDEKKKKGAG